MRELASTTNTSWEQFKGNWKNVTFGGMSYLLRHPFSGWKVIKPRLRFALQKRNLEKEIRVPEGFTLRFNSELLVYTQIFAEQNLKYRPMIKEFRYYPNPIVIDVGYNCGFVTKWLYGINHTAIFYGIEVLEQHIERSREMDRKMREASYCPALDKGFVPEVEVFHNAAWNKTGEKIKINIGNRVAVGSEGFEIDTLAVDDIPGVKNQPIFLLKIDTDGSNIEVLKGATKVIEKCKWILIEEDPGVLEYVKENLKGWEINRLTNCDLVLRNKNL